MASKHEGKTFNVTRAVGKKPDGKTQWQPYGRAFIRTDLTGGALYVGKGDDNTTYELSPKEGNTKTGGKSFEARERGSDELHGRLFVRADLSGGALWVGTGNDEEQYALFPRVPRPAQQAAPATPAAMVQGA